MHRSELRVLLRALPIAIAVISGGCGASVSAPPPDARAQLQQAISAADAAGSFRVRGQLTAGPAVVAWDGVVVGNDEQYLVDAMGSLLDERRIAGVAWARPTDQSRPWASVPSAEAFDLSVLLDGTMVSAMRSDDRVLVEVHFSGRDVLRAITHIPSVGPTEVTATIAFGVITAIDLHLEDGAAAHLELSDYGQALFIDPIPRDDSGAANNG